MARERERVRIRRTIRVLTVNAIAEGNDAIAPEAKGGGGREERERVYSTCRLLVRNGTSIFHADRCDVRFIVNTFRATTSNRHSLSSRSTSFTVADVTRRFHGLGRREGGEVISYTTILALQPVVNRFVVNVALGCIDVNASAGLKNVSQGFER